MQGITGNTGATGTTGAQGPTGSPAPETFTFPTRSLNTAFQISTTNNAIVTYTVDITCTLTLSGGQTGTVTLEYADDSGFTTNVKTVCRPSSSNSGALSLGLSLTQVGGGAVSGVIPASKFVRLLTSGTCTFTLQNAEEVLV